MDGLKEFHDVRVRLAENVDGLHIEREQEIPDWYLDQLADARFDSMHTPAGDFYRIASIPVAIVEKWQAQGFDIYRESIQDIVKRLKMEGLDKLMATSKRI